MTTSEKLFERACRVIPGGVNSPVRAFGSVGRTPRMIACAGGAYMTDEDGNRYLDFVGSAGEKTFRGLVHGAGLRLPFEAGCVRDTAGKVLTYLEEHPLA